MIRFGTVEGVRERISGLRDMLRALGNEGSFTIEAPPNVADLKISESVSIEVQTPMTIDYKIDGDRVIIKFREPYPRATYRVLSKLVDGVTLTTDRIEFSVRWAPDGYLEVA